MVNPGAIATTSLARRTAGGALAFIHDGLSRFAGRELALNEEVYASRVATNFRNRGLAWLLESQGRIYCDPPRRSTSTPASARSRSPRATSP